MSVDYKSRNDAPAYACAHCVQDSRVLMCVFCGNVALPCVRTLWIGNAYVHEFYCAFCCKLYLIKGFALLRRVFTGKLHYALIGLYGLWIMTPCSLVDWCQLFGGAWCYCLPGFGVKFEQIPGVAIGAYGCDSPRLLPVPVWPSLSAAGHVWPPRPIYVFSTDLRKCVRMKV
jgi:hypothetical protein